MMERTDFRELRVGNWVNTHDGYKQVESVCARGMNVYIDGAAPYDDEPSASLWWEHQFFSPIPLTLEILEKAGFVKKDNGYWLGESYYFNGEKLYYFPLDCPNEGYADELPPYLHWLQNHYYFSRVEELEINL